MDNENIAPQEQNEDLLDWVPPELAERARIYEERDANTSKKKAKRMRGPATPPEGKFQRGSLVLLIAGMSLLALNWFLAAVGVNGQQAVMQKGRLWFALWMVSQACTLCVYLLFLLPLGREMRRPALITIMGAGLLSNVVANASVIVREEGDYSLGLRLTMAAIMTAIALAVTPNVWLLSGLLRRKTAEKRAAALGLISIAISLVGLISTLAQGRAAAASPPLYVNAIGIAQMLMYSFLLAGWPVLDRAVLTPKPEGEMEDEQPE